MIVGDILLTRNNKGLLNWLIRKLTNSVFTHNATVFFYQGGTTSVIEASTSVKVVPFTKNYQDNPDESWVVVRVKTASAEQIQRSLISVWWEYSGNPYGVFQLIWFVWRWINEKFGRDIRSKKAWFPGGQICSEILWHYLDRLGVPEITKAVRQWNSDSVHVEDFHKLFKSMPEHFEFIGGVWRAGE